MSFINIVKKTVVGLTFTVLVCSSMALSAQEDYCGDNSCPYDTNCCDSDYCESPFAVQVSSSGQGISFLYIPNGSKNSGMYYGSYNSFDYVRVNGHNSHFYSTSLWAGRREKLNIGCGCGFFLVYGFEIGKDFGKILGTSIKDSYFAGPYAGVHYYLTHNWFVSAYTYPVLYSTNKFAGNRVHTYEFFKGAISLGYQF